MDEAEKSIEEKLALADWRDRLFLAAREAGEEGYYDDVADYDAVLKWHCRL